MNLGRDLVSSTESVLDVLLFSYGINESLSGNATLFAIIITKLLRADLEDLCSFARSAYQQLKVDSLYSIVLFNVYCFILMRIL